MAKKRRKGEQGQGTCVYCGQVRPITDDHVFPQVIFHVLDDQMITVPACQACQQIKSLGDRDLRNFMLMDIGGSQHPDAEDMTAKMLRHTNVRFRNWIQKQIANAEEIDLVTEDGLIVGKASSFEFDMQRIEVAQAMTVRGLYFRETGSALPPDCPIHVQHVPWYAAPKFVSNMNRVAPTRFQTRGNNVASWGYNKIADGDDYDTAWQVFYNNWVVFLTTTGRTAIASRDGRTAFDAKQQLRTLTVRGLRRRVVVPRDLNGKPLILPQ